MIITRRKTRQAIEQALAGHRRIALIGCGLCAATCETGGEEQVREMARLLGESGKEVLAELMVEGVCHRRRLELLSRQEASRLEGADAFLVLACGSGVQTAAEVFSPLVLPGLDTLFLGQIRKHGEFREVCTLCGDCALDGAGITCPIARCPKSLVNGPCGGSEGGQCEVIRENPCAWIEIFEQSRRRGTEAALEGIREPRDHSRSTHPARLTLEKKKKPGTRPGRKGSRDDT